MLDAAQSNIILGKGIIVQDESIRVIVYGKYVFSEGYQLVVTQE